MALSRLLMAPTRFCRLGGALSCTLMKQPTISQPVVTFKPPEELRKVLSTTARLEGIGKAGMLPSLHWTVERVFAVLSVIAIPVAFLAQNWFLDCVLCFIVVLHFHWGLEGVFKDYLCRKLIMNKPVDPRFGKLCIAILYFFTIITLVGLIHFNVTDVGITTAVKLLWTLD